MPNSAHSKILLVDDDPQALQSTRKILELAGHELHVAQDGQEALDTARDQGPFDLVISDVRMPRLGGLEFLRAIQLRGENTPVLLMTAFGRVEDAVWAMKLGAVDFLTKPFKRQTLLNAVDGALKRTRIPNRALRLALRLNDEGALLGHSQSILDLRQMIAQVAPTAATVLLTGESGTGKELAAKLLHSQSTRKGEKWIALNCAALPEQLMESELFGHERGAFTGATHAKEGLFEAAHGGTLLLDEIGDMPLMLQAKLLRVLQESEVRRVGATASRKIDVRVVAATNRNLREAVTAGLFREDLLYRLEVVHLRVPPLRERMDDLRDLAGHFLARACARHGKTVVGISDEAIQLLMGHVWPGNVRELSNVIERAVVFATSEMILPENLPPTLALGWAGSSTPLAKNSIHVPLGTTLKDVEELLIRKTLEATDGDKNMTAKLLGINSRTIYRKLDSKNSE